MNEATVTVDRPCKKIGRIIAIAAAALVGAIALCLLALSIRHRVLLQNEQEYLAALGYVNPVMLDDGRRINVIRKGSTAPKHTIVVLAGLGMSDTSVTMEQMLSGFYAENEVVYIDRAGYGFSDDTDAAQTNEHIVADYRDALRCAGIEAPYLLLAHSIGGAYATDWETRYPDEIEAVIFVDGSQLSADAFADEKKESAFTGFLDRVGCRLGIGRLFLRDDYYLLPYTSWIREQQILNHLKTASTVLDESVVAHLLEEYEKIRQESLMPYIEKLGSCDLVLLGGDHMIYEQKPAECAALIGAFLKKLN